MRIIIPIQIIELEENNYHIHITSVFYDSKIGNWIIDTGASKTVFDKNKADYYNSSDETEELHSAIVGEKPLETSLAFLKPLEFGKLRIENMNVALLDLEHINELYSKTTNVEVCGLLGGDFLVKYRAVIDYKKSTLTLKGV